MLDLTQTPIPRNLEQLLVSLELVVPLFDAIPGVVFFIKDTQARYALVNQTLVSRLGFKHKGELVGRTAEEVFPARFGPQYTEQDRRVLADGRQLANQLELHLYYGNQPVCTVGENTSLSVAEKISLVEVAKDASAGRLPVISGIAEFTSYNASEVAKQVAKAGADGIMLMPALVYSSKPFETAAHFRTVAAATDLPMMVYNNPPIYKNDVTPDILISLADCDNIVCFKDSSGNTNRFIDVRNEVGERFILFAGLDDVLVASVAVGAVGWVSGMSNAFPKEGETLFRLAKAGRFAEAMALYEWFMPLLHLDARPDLVQCIKLCEAIMQRGSALTRPPHAWPCRTRIVNTSRA